MKNTIQYIPCAFINTTDPPAKMGPIDNLWVKHTQGYSVRPDELTLYVTRQYHYPHPDAPDEAMISVATLDKTITARIGDIEYPALYMLLQAQSVVLNLLST